VIYISTSCVKNTKIKDSVVELAVNGFKNIELSGGTEHYDDLEVDLLELKSKYKLNYRCHNYFPPPKKHFVLNLASLDNEIFKVSFEHLRHVIGLSKRLESDKFAFHAGFFTDIKVREIGKKITKNNLYNQKASIDRFCSAFKILQEESEGLDLYIENNVFSKDNFESYKGMNPFMMTSFTEYELLKNRINFKLLLDVAHLKVSSKTLKLNWNNEFSNMIQSSDYIHISNNDGFNDLNYELNKHSDMFELLRQSNLENKDFTLEVYSNMDKIKESYETLEEAIL
jgi:sugar phosphate isomerase/epimerase